MHNLILRPPTQTQSAVVGVIACMHAHQLPLPQLSVLQSTEVLWRGWSTTSPSWFPRLLRRKPWSQCRGLFSNHSLRLVGGACWLVVVSKSMQCSNQRQLQKVVLSQRSKHSCGLITFFQPHQKKIVYIRAVEHHSSPL